MTITQVRYFLAVSTCGSFSKAAEVLHVSQPALSSAIKELETEFNTPLLLRHSNGVSVTEEGRRFQSQAQELLAHFNDVTETFTLPSQRDHQLILGVSPMNGSVVIPKLLTDFYSTNPAARLDIHEGGTPELINLVSRGRLDAAIISRKDCLGEEIRRMSIMNTKILLCVHEGHPIAKQDRLTIPMLRDTPIVTFFNDYEQSSMLDRVFLQHGLKPNIIYRTGQLSMVERIIRQGLAAGFLFESLASEIMDIRAFEIPEIPPCSITLIWKKHHHLYSSTKSFIRIAAQYARS